MSYTCATLRSRHYAAFFPCFSTIYEGVFKFRASLALARPDRGAERDGIQRPVPPSGGLRSETMTVAAVPGAPPHYLGTALNASWGILTRWVGILADGVKSHKRRLP